MGNEVLRNQIEEILLKLERLFKESKNQTWPQCERRYEELRQLLNDFSSAKSIEITDKKRRYSQLEEAFPNKKIKIKEEKTNIPQKENKKRAHEGIDHSPNKKIKEEQKEEKLIENEMICKNRIFHKRKYSEESNEKPPEKKMKIKALNLDKKEEADISSKILNNA